MPDGPGYPAYFVSPSIPIANMSNIQLFNECNMAVMSRYPDGYFDLAIVDPPYGIGNKFKGGKSGKMNFNEVVDKGWDNVPNEAYFKELFRVSKHQIVWGGNYFDLPPSRCFIVWDKGISEDFSLAMAELAWTSFDKLAKIFKMIVPKDGKIHPTQKPTDLYKWVLKRFATPDMRILDTHLGSMSSVIAAYDYGVKEFVGCEIDTEYFEKGVARFNQHKRQLNLFAA